MRATDNRYAGEMSKFNLAVRMIGHEARTGTIRACTGFSEDRIRKIYGTYFKKPEGTTVKRRRGKSPKQIAPFVSGAQQQAESTVLACLLLHCGLLRPHQDRGCMQAARMDAVTLGEHMCDAFETYRAIYPDPQLCFEKTWGLFNALAHKRELILAVCDSCGGPYVQDRFALDYAHCPFCEIKDPGSAVR